MSFFSGKKHQVVIFSEIDGKQRALISSIHGNKKQRGGISSPFNKKQQGVTLNNFTGKQRPMILSAFNGKTISLKKQRGTI